MTAAVLAFTGSQIASGIMQAVGTIVFLAVCVAVAYGWRRLKRAVARAQEQARARDSYNRGELLDGSDREAIASSRPTTGLAAIRGHDPEFDEHEFVSGAEQTLMRLTDAVSRRRADLVRPLVADRLYATFGTLIAQSERARRRSTTDRISFADSRIVGAHSDARYDTITLRVAQIVEGTTERQGRDGSTKVRSSGGVMLRDAIFQRSSAAVRRPDGGLLAQRCPSCQAPLDVDGDGRCVYCHHTVLNGDFDWVLVRFEIPGEGVGPRVTPEEMAALAGASGRRVPRAVSGLLDELRNAATVAENAAGRLTSEQRHAVLKDARGRMGQPFANIFQFGFIVGVSLFTFVLLAKAMRNADDPWNRTVTVGGSTRDLHLLHLLPLAVAVLFAVPVLVSVLRLVHAFAGWVRAHGPASTAEGEVVFREGAYRVVLAGARALVPWQRLAHGRTATGLEGLMPGPYRLHLAPGNRLLSLVATGDETTMLAALTDALRTALGHDASALDLARAAAQVGAARAVEGYAAVEPSGALGRVSLVLREVRVLAPEAAGAALVAGVWYRLFLDGDTLLAVEPLPAERATSTAVDPDAVVGDLDAVAAHDPNFDEATFLSRVATTFRLVHEAWTRLDARVSRGVMSDGLWQAHRRQIDEMRERGRRAVHDGLAVTATAVRSAERTARWDTVVVRIGARGSDYDVATTADGEEHVVRGDREVRAWQEDWIFHRAADATTPADGGTLEQHCPNCHAQLSLDDAGSCSWCRCPISGGQLDWVVTRIDRVATPPGGVLAGAPRVTQPAR